jgi:hypothetical protein
MHPLHPSLRYRYVRERAQVDAVIAATTHMQQFAGPRAVAAVLDRFGPDDDIAAAAAMACSRSLDIIEKVAAAHEGETGQALMRTCIQLLILSGLPLQLFRSFCARSACLGALMNAQPRHPLLLQLLTATCRCVSAAQAWGVVVPSPLTIGMSQYFQPRNLADGRLQRASLVDIMALTMAQPTVDSTSSAVLLLLSLLLSHCVAFEMPPPDTTVMTPVALHVMRHSPCILLEILLPSNASAHLPLSLASASCSALLLVLAASHMVAAAAEPSDPTAWLFVNLLLRVALIAFARGSPHPASTLAVYQRVFSLLVGAVDRICPGLIDAEQPLLQRLAADEDDDSSGNLVHLYRQFVLSDQTAAAICASALNDAVFAVRNPDVSEAVIEDAAREENAADLAERRHDVEDDVLQPAAAFDLQEAILDAQNQVIQSHLPFDLHALILTSLVHF